ncbi:MAG: hypothetical protein IJK19_05700 [Bacteroidales bacterium]|nr:hypothetical protein [Bacteroidales bacterium]
MTVIYQEAPFDNENINVNFTPSEDGKTASITLHQIRFVPQMPVTIDVPFPILSCRAPARRSVSLAKGPSLWQWAESIPDIRSQTSRAKSSAAN